MNDRLRYEALVAWCEENRLGNRWSRACERPSTHNVHAYPGFTVASSLLLRRRTSSSRHHLSSTQRFFLTFLHQKFHLSCLPPKTQDTILLSSKLINRRVNSENVHQGGQGVAFLALYIRESPLCFAAESRAFVREREQGSRRNKEKERRMPRPKGRSVRCQRMRAATLCFQKYDILLHGKRQQPMTHTRFVNEKKKKLDKPKDPRYTGSLS